MIFKIFIFSKNFFKNSYFFSIFGQKSQRFATSRNTISGFMVRPKKNEFFTPLFEMVWFWKMSIFCWSAYFFRNKSIFVQKKNVPFWEKKISKKVLVGGFFEIKLLFSLQFSNKTHFFKFFKWNFVLHYSILDKNFCPFWKKKK